MSDLVKGLLTFLNESPTPFHAVSAMSWRLAAAGFSELSHVDPTTLEPGRGYFLTRNDSSIVAFRASTKPVVEGIRLVGAHTDSPNLAVKPNPLKVRHGVAQLAVDVYGGALLNPWFDRDLSLAGRISFVAEEGTLASELIDFARPVAFIPSLAIHLDREANHQRSVNPQRDILPILTASDGATPLDLPALLAAEVRREFPEYGEIRVLDFELSLYDCQPPALVGLHDEFIASARLDNLLSCYLGLTALLEAPTDEWSVLICNDHEEVGSASAVGAQGPMLTETLLALTGGDSALARLREHSWMLSVDNAHAVHPNFSDKHDDNHGPILNRGPVIKINRNQRYATSGRDAARIKLLAERANVPVQTFVMRTDMGCGSTIGPITATETGIPTADIGLPTLGMHSIRELAGADDPAHLKRLLVAFLARAA